MATNRPAKPRTNPDCTATCHGTRNAYYGGCRCPETADARRDFLTRRDAAHEARRAAAGNPIRRQQRTGIPGCTTGTHGTAYAYRNGCICPSSAAALAAAQQRHAAAQRARRNDSHTRAPRTRLWNGCPSTGTHATAYAAIVHGCTCAPAAERWTERTARRRRYTAGQSTPPDKLPADPATVAALIAGRITPANASRGELVAAAHRMTSGIGCPRIPAPHVAKVWRMPIAAVETLAAEHERVLWSRRTPARNYGRT